MRAVNLVALGFSAWLASGAEGPFQGAANRGLMGVGRIPAATFDQAGDRRSDTLSGFSAMAVDQKSVARAGSTITGRLVALSDRGFGDGSTAYRPRLQIYDFGLRPYYGAAPAPQNQLALTNVATILLSHSDGEHFTGFDAGDLAEKRFPKSLLNSPGRGRRALDAEGLALMPDGSAWVSDEYGPFLYLFDSQGRLRETLRPPEAFLPRVGGSVSFTAEQAPASGRAPNRGFEGLAATPSGRRLAAMLQSPAMQDGGAFDYARNTRMVEFDIQAGSPSFGKLAGEYVYQLTYNGNNKRTKTTVVSALAAVNETTFLALERDSNGRGGDEDAPVYKRVVLISTAGATNLAGTGYDLAPGTRGSLSLPPVELPRGIRPVSRQDLVDILDRNQLRRFGIAASKNPNKDPQAISEKWEGMALFPLGDPTAPDDCILLVGNDNDFKARQVFHEGRPVGKNKVEVDLMILAFRVTLPSFGLGIGKK